MIYFAGSCVKVSYLMDDKKSAGACTRIFAWTVEGSCPSEALRLMESDHHMGKSTCHNCKYPKGRIIVSAGQLFNNFRCSVPLHLHRGVCSPVQQLVGSYVARGRRASSGETCFINVCEPRVLHCVKDLPNNWSLCDLWSSGIWVVDMPLVLEHPS